MGALRAGRFLHSGRPATPRCDARTAGRGAAGRGFAGRQVKRRWLLEAPEALCVCVGAALRLGGRDYAPMWGYDFQQHWYYVDYLATHHTIPPPSYGTAAYHPPLYYWI